MKTSVLFALIGLAGVLALPVPREGEGGGAVDDSGAAGAGAGEGGGGEGAGGGELGHAEKLAAALGISVPPGGAGEGGGGEGGGGAVDDPAAAAAAGGATGPTLAELQERLGALEPELVKLREERAAVESRAAMEKALETELGPKLDALDKLVSEGRLTEAEAEAQAVALADAWKQGYQGKTETETLRAKLAAYEAKDAQAATLREVEKAFAETPELRYGGDAAKKQVLTLTSAGKSVADAVAETKALCTALYGAAVKSEQERTRAAGAQGPALGGSSGLGAGSGAGKSGGSITFEEAMRQGYAGRR